MVTPTGNEFPLIHGLRVKETQLDESPTHLLTVQLEPGSGEGIVSHIPFSELADVLGFVTLDTEQTITKQKTLNVDDGVALEINQTIGNIGVSINDTVGADNSIQVNKNVGVSDSFYSFMGETTEGNSFVSESNSGALGNAIVVRRNGVNTFTVNPDGEIVVNSIGENPGLYITKNHNASSTVEFYQDGDAATIYGSGTGAGNTLTLDSIAGNLIFGNAGVFVIENSGKVTNNVGDNGSAYFENSSASSTVYIANGGAGNLIQAEGVGTFIVDINGDAYSNSFKLLTDADMTGGTVTFTLDGIEDTFVIPHGLGTNPSSIELTFSDGSNTDFIQSIRSKDSTNITIVAANVPGSGSIDVYWRAYK